MCHRNVRKFCPRLCQKQSERYINSTFSWGGMPPDPPSRHACISHATIILLPSCFPPPQLKFLYETLRSEEVFCASACVCGHCMHSCSRLLFSLTSQTHFRKKGKGLVNYVYKPCPAALYSAVQSRCSILSHDALHHCLSSNNSLENGERELGHLFHYCRSCKNSSTILLRERAYSTTGNSRVHYLKTDYIIQLIAFRWNMAYKQVSQDPSLFLRK